MPSDFRWHSFLVSAGYLPDTNEVFNNPDNTYKDEFNAEFDKWLESLDYDYKAEENKERFKEDKAKYTTENLDHAKWSTRLDEELFVQFLDFYNTAIK